MKLLKTFERIIDTLNKNGSYEEYLYLRQRLEKPVREARRTEDWFYSRLEKTLHTLKWFDGDEYDETDI